MALNEVAGAPSRNFEQGRRVATHRGCLATGREMALAESSTGGAASRSTLLCSFITTKQVYPVILEEAALHAYVDAGTGQGARLAQNG